MERVRERGWEPTAKECSWGPVMYTLNTMVVGVGDREAGEAILDAQK